MINAVVIGGGVVGCMTAWRLAQRGWSVTLFDADAPPAGATAATHSNLSIYNRTPGPELTLAIETAEIYSSLMSDGYDEIGYHELGGVLLIEHPDDIEAAERRVSQQRDAGVACDLVEGSDLRRADPSVGAAAIAGITSPRSGVVYAPGVVHALIRAGITAGVELRTFTMVTGASEIPGGWRIETNRGNLVAEHVVIAAGASAGSVAALFGVELNITPVRGHIAITTRQERRGIAMKGEFVNRERRPAGHGGARLVWTHTPEGHVFIGRSSEPGRAEHEVDVDIVRSILARARHWLPGAGSMAVQRVYTGVRPEGPNARAVVGPSADADNVWLAAGFGDIGIGLAASARHLADRMAGDNTPVIDTFSPSRAQTTPGARKDDHHARETHHW